MYRQRKEDKKAILPPIVPGVELATLREMPRGNFVQSNVLYASTLQCDPDDSALPKIRQDQITLARFLGSGAFGKVTTNSLDTPFTFDFTNFLIKNFMTIDDYSEIKLMFPINFIF